MNNHTDEPERERQRKEYERWGLNWIEKQTSYKKIEIRMSWNQASEILQARCLLGVFRLSFHRSVDVFLLFSSVHSSINNSNKEKPPHQCWMMHPCFCFSVNFICRHNRHKQITEMQKVNNLQSEAPSKQKDEILAGFSDCRVAIRVLQPFLFQGKSTVFFSFLLLIENNWYEHFLRNKSLYSCSVVCFTVEIWPSNLFAPILTKILLSDYSAWW